MAINPEKKGNYLDLDATFRYGVPLREVYTFFGKNNVDVNGNPQIISWVDGMDMLWGENGKEKTDVIKSLEEFLSLPRDNHRLILV